jgi:hypothetical protein
MITDSNNLPGLIGNALVGSIGGDWLLLAILFILIIGIALIYARARASLVLTVGMISVFIFGLLVPELTFLFWLILLISGFVLIMGLRRWLTSQ